MFAATLNRLAISPLEIVCIREGKKATHRGALPTWIRDPMLSEQLLKDTGLTSEELGEHSTGADSKRILSQLSCW